MKERIIAMLKASDIEMVKLGSVLLTKLPRKDWTPILRDCQGDVRTDKRYWSFIINHNKIIINEMKYDNLNYYNYITSWTNVDLDEMRNNEIKRKSEKLRRESIKYKNRI